MEFWAALCGALVGGAASALTAWGVLVAEAGRRERERFTALRRELTVSLARDLIDLQACVANASMNSGRFGEVESSAESSLALFQAHLDLPDEVAVAEFAFRVRHSVRFATAPGSVWGDAGFVRTRAVEPLLRWSVGDETYPDAWFRARVSISPDAFSTTSYDIEPAATRMAMRIAG